MVQLRGEGVHAHSFLITIVPALFSLLEVVGPTVWWSGRGELFTQFLLEALLDETDAFHIQLLFQNWNGPREPDC